MKPVGAHPIRTGSALALLLAGCGLLLLVAPADESLQAAAMSGRGSAGAAPSALSGPSASPVTGGEGARVLIQTRAARGNDQPLTPLSKDAEQFLIDARAVLQRYYDIQFRSLEQERAFDVDAAWEEAARTKFRDFSDFDFRARERRVLEPRTFGDRYRTMRIEEEAEYRTRLDAYMAQRVGQGGSGKD